ncbi:MAG: hypothetical protein WHT06_15450 [Desulfobacterales bacterium]
MANEKKPVCGLPATLAAWAGLLFAAPLLGAAAAGRWHSGLLAFPPRPPDQTAAASFSWAAFLLVAALGAATLLPVAARAARSFRAAPRRIAPRHGRHPFPPWGWGAIVLGAVSWAAAWGGLPALEPLRPYSFTPLWLAYILVVNALCVRRTGSSLLTREPALFLALFPASALFWWAFEYLNRFVGNWSYRGESFGPLGYLGLASLCFSTVLPAVLSTREWILSQAVIRRAFGRMRPLSPRFGRIPPRAAVPLAVLMLAATAAWPARLYPLLWVAPLVLLGALCARRGSPPILGALLGQDWTEPAAAALAGLVCGFFWEMWNHYSLLRWVYHIPGVDRFRIFEMPLLGYLGYLPFGLLCAVLGELLRQALAARKGEGSRGL